MKTTFVHHKFLDTKKEVSEHSDRTWRNASDPGASAVAGEQSEVQKNERLLVGNLKRNKK